MRRSWVPYAFVGVILYAVFLFALAPPTWVAWGVTRMSSSALTLSDVQGTLWSGNGVLIASSTRSNLGRLHWRINPAWLPVGQVAAKLDLSSPGTRFSARLRVGFGSVRVRDVMAHFSPAVVGVLYPPFALADPKGDIELRADSAIITRNTIEGEANLVWRGAAINLSSVRPLGNYQLQLKGHERTLNATLRTQGGALHLNGQGRWLPFDAGRLEFSGVARAAAQQNDLAPLLAMLGAKSSGEARLLIQAAFSFR